jgi:hypothetical protein
MVFRNPSCPSSRCTYGIRERSKRLTVLTVMSVVVGPADEEAAFRAALDRVVLDGVQGSLFANLVTARDLFVHEQDTDLRAITADPNTSLRSSTK